LKLATTLAAALHALSFANLELPQQLLRLLPLSPSNLKGR
jgi:hypothetical protein